MICVAICDDEQEMSEQIRLMAAAFFRKKNREATIVQFSRGEDVLHYDKQIDILFLDIQMEGIDGIETVRRLRNQRFGGFLIFITILKELVFQSFEVQPFDYLLKPVQPEGLAQTLNRLRQALEKQADPEQLLIQRGQERLLVDLQQLVYCEVLGRKVYLHLQGLDGKTEVIDFYERLDNLQARLDARFFRCHRSYLVNLAFVRGCSGGRLRLAQGEEIPVSRLREAELRQALLAAMQKGSGYGRV